MPGPVPNRSDDLARPRERKGKDIVPVTKGELLPVNDVPEADPEWHEIAQMLYNSLFESGQKSFYQKSDWILAWSLCEDLSTYKKSGKRSGQMLQTIYSTMTDLLVTEGARRRVRVELTEPPAEEDAAAVLMLAEYQQGLDTSDDEDDEEDDD